MKKLALCLSGGGFKGAYQLGFAEALHQRGILFSMTAGISVGSLNAAMIAQNKWKVLHDFWWDVIQKGASEIYTSNMVTFDTGKPKPNLEAIVEQLKPSLNAWQIAKLLFSKQARLDTAQEILTKASKIQSLADNKPLQTKLLATVKRDDFLIPFYTGFVSFDDMQYHCVSPDDFDSDDQLALAIAASATMPIVWSPIPEIQTKAGKVQINVDGGVRNISPLGDVVDHIAALGNEDEWTILIVNCTTDAATPLGKDRNIATYALRMNDILLSEVFRGDLKLFLERNDDVRNADGPIFRKGKQLKYFDYILVEPSTFEIGDTLDASADTLHLRY